VAPLAASVVATLAATVAVGVGVALARAERERRFSRTRLAAERQFALLPGELPADGLRRIALGQLDLAIELLGGANGAPPDEHAVHETRKALKRLRALVRLLERELGAEAFARENQALRDTGRRLAGARDAEVMVSTLEVLLARHPRKLGRRRSLVKLRRRLVAEREAATARTLGDAAMRAGVLEELWAIRGRVAAWRLGGAGGLQQVEPGIERLYRQGRRRYRRAANAKGDRGRALHEWRKRVKDLRYAAEMLDREDPAVRGKRRRGPAGGKAAKLIPELARDADRLGEALGEEHDLALLAERIRESSRRGAGPARLGRRSRRAVLKVIARRRRKLRARTLGEGARLYRRKPKRFVGRVRRAYERAAIIRR
jgi:CHAD domain-containing protein